MPNDGPCVKKPNKSKLLGIFLLLLALVICGVYALSNSHKAFDYAYPYVEGVALVEKDGKWGFIDSTENVIIPMDYDFAMQFYKGWAMVQRDNKYGFIDKNCFSEKR